MGICPIRKVGMPHNVPHKKALTISLATHSLSHPPDSSSSLAIALVTNTALISRQTLTHVGLSAPKGDEIWSQWTDWPADGPRSEIDADDGGFHKSYTPPRTITANITAYHAQYVCFQPTIV